MVDITEISAMVAAAGVLVGVVYYILDMRHQSKVRETDLVMRLYATWGSTEFQIAYQRVMSLEFEDYADYRKRYGTNAEIKAAETTVNTFFEGIGVLAKRKLTSMSLANDLFATAILSAWKKRKPVIEGSRKRFARPSMWEWFEYLYNEVKKENNK